MSGAQSLADAETLDTDTTQRACPAQSNCQLRDHEPTPHFPCLARNPAHSVVIAWSVRALTDRDEINYWVNGKMRDEGVLNTEVWTPFILWDCFLPPGQSATCTDFLTQGCILCWSDSSLFANCVSLVMTSGLPTRTLAIPWTRQLYGGLSS